MSLLIAIQLVGVTSRIGSVDPLRGHPIADVYPAVRRRIYISVQEHPRLSSPPFPTALPPSTVLISMLPRDRRESHGSLMVLRFSSARYPRLDIRVARPMRPKKLIN